MFSVLLLIIIVLQSSQGLELQTQLDERTEEVLTIFLSTLAYVHTAPEKFSTSWKIWMDIQGAKKVIFTAYHSGKRKLTFTSPQNVLMSRLISQFFRNLNSSKKFTCLSGKLTTEFTSPIAKSTSPGLSASTFFVRWYVFHTEPFHIFALFTWNIEWHLNFGMVKVVLCEQNTLTHEFSAGQKFRPVPCECSDRLVN